MAVNLYHRREPSPGSFAMKLGNLSLLTAYENGSVVLREYVRKEKEFSIEGEGWDTIWASKLHVESSKLNPILFARRSLTPHLVMAMRVSPSHDFALTASADHIIGRYDLTVRLFLIFFLAVDGSKSIPSYRLKNIRQSSLVLFTARRIQEMDQSQSEKMAKCVQLEDGTEGMWLFIASSASSNSLSFRIRLHSTKSLKPLGSLKYHKSACQCVEFPRSIGNATMEEDEDFESKDDTNDDDEEMGPEEKLERSRWLIAGAKDGRVSIWALMSFQK
jgi:hypothetical protein